MSNIQKQHKISPAIAWLTIQKFIIFYCPLDGEHTKDEAMEYFNKVTERYQVEAEEADVQDIDIVYIVDQTALDEKTSVLVPCFRYKFTCKGEAEDFFWANDTIIGSSQKQGEMLVNAVNGSTDSIFGSEFLK